MFTINLSRPRAAQCLAVVCGLATMSMAAPAWAAHGATPVTVENPTTSPVPTTDVDNPALQPFQKKPFAALVHEQPSDRYLHGPAREALGYRIL
jgi:hypothetical protein